MNADSVKRIWLQPLLRCFPSGGITPPRTDEGLSWNHCCLEPKHSRTSSTSRFAKYMILRPLKLVLQIAKGVESTLFLGAASTVSSADAAVDDCLAQRPFDTIAAEPVFPANLTCESKDAVVDDLLAQLHFFTTAADTVLSASSTSDNAQSNLVDASAAAQAASALEVCGVPPTDLAQSSPVPGIQHPATLEKPLPVWSESDLDQYEQSWFDLAALKFDAATSLTSGDLRENSRQEDSKFYRAVPGQIATSGRPVLRAPCDSLAVGEGIDDHDHDFTYPGGDFVRWPPQHHQHESKCVVVEAVSTSPLGKVENLQFVGVQVQTCTNSVLEVSLLGDDFDISEQTCHMAFSPEVWNSSFETEISRKKGCSSAFDFACACTTQPMRPHFDSQGCQLFLDMSLSASIIMSASRTRAVVVVLFCFLSCLATIVAAQDPEHTNLIPSESPSPTAGAESSIMSRIAIHKTLFGGIVGVVMVTTFLGCMVPHTSSNALRTPNAWGPEMEPQYAFRSWSRDILLWSIASDLEPSRKAASVMLQLRGAAKEVARQIPPQAIVQGGIINSTPVDPLTFLMHSLQERFGNLGEEVRIQAVTELMGFSRKGQESIDALLVRFDSVRARSAEQGGAIISIQGVSWLLLRSIGITDNQLIQLLAPFGGLFPPTEAELTQLKISLRRMGHILERAPGNLRESLRPAGHSQSAFLMSDPSSEHQWAGENSESTWQDLHGHGSIQSLDDWYQPAAAQNASSASYHAHAPPEQEFAFLEEDVATDSDTSSGSEAVGETVDFSGDPNRVAQDLF